MQHGLFIWTDIYIRVFRILPNIGTQTRIMLAEFNLTNTSVEARYILFLLISVCR